MTQFPRLFVCAAALALAGQASAEQSQPAEQAQAAPVTQRYTFSWPLHAQAPAPRGGTTRGPEEVLDLAPSPEWVQLQAADLPPRERDRRAILAMAGSYRVTFDFLEVMPFLPQPKPRAPYQSWATEKVYVDRNEPDHISLLHVLEMRFLQEDGSISEPMVSKHWRQDWQYQPRYIVEYQGNDSWERRRLKAEERRGTWVQTVFQVDDSPRYASVGRWEHSGSFSSWISGDTWRPLPRREWASRDDYQVLVGTNRHTITPTGWVQEENNLKTVLAGTGQVDAQRPYVAREYGVARYERIKADFAAADEYYQRTQAFWDEVRQQWNAIFAREGEVTLQGPVDRLGLFMPLFTQAEAVAEQGERASARNAGVIHDALRAMGALP